MEGLVVYPENMLRNMNLLNGVFYSQKVMLALVDKGMSREDAYSAVQKHAMRVWEGEGGLLELVGADPEISGRLSGEELGALFDPRGYLTYVDEVFERVFGSDLALLADESGNNGTKEPGS